MSPERNHFHLHLISDATGETVQSLARASLAQFEGVECEEHFWPLIRSRATLDKAIKSVAANPGFVLYTLVDEALREELETACRDLKVPTVSVLDPVVMKMAAYLGVRSSGRPGGQHALDAGYFGRIDAMNFVLTHDDGQAAETLNQADIVLVGVSRTSKTPTCIYLANRGIKAANVPMVPNCPLPPELLQADGPLIVGLTEDPARLVHVRRNRMRLLAQDQDTDYTDLESVRAEVVAARRLFTDRGWPVIDVTRRSIEETATAVLQLYAEGGHKLP
ncbi:MAG: kinase/pyrophosphorylase [Alphaproteobacteria bacterium]|nr:kinase/pyrophosphorylase [Alphaproteobacteria bacterium]